jgi:hypothetical protein
MQLTGIFRRVFATGKHPRRGATERPQDLEPARGCRLFETKEQQSMTRILARLTAILTVLSGPASDSPQPDLPSFRDGIQCLFCFESGDALLDKGDIARGTAAAAAQPGITQRQALRGICLLQCLPVGNQSPARAVSRSTCPLEWICAQPQTSLVDRTIEDLICAGKRGANCLKLGMNRALQSIAPLNRSQPGNVLLLIPGMAKSISWVSRPTPSGLTPTSATGSYWNYYADCDRWERVFCTLEESARATGAHSGSSKQAGTLPGIVAIRAQQVVAQTVNMFAAMVDEAAVLGERAGAFLTGIARLRPWQLQHSQPWLLWVD